MNNNNLSISNAKQADYFHRLYPRSIEEVEPYIDESTKASTVLDIACGSGSYAIHWAPHVKKLVGFDISAPMINIAEKEAAKNNLLNTEFHVADMKYFDFGEKFDLIAIPGNSFSLLTTIEDQVACLESISKHLEEGGKIMIQIVLFQEMFCKEPSFTKEVKDEESGLVYQVKYDSKFRYENTFFNFDLIFKTFDNGKEIDHTSSYVKTILPTSRELDLLFKYSGFKVLSIDNSSYSKIYKCIKL